MEVTEGAAFLQPSVLSRACRAQDWDRLAQSVPWLQHQRTWIRVTRTQVKARIHGVSLWPLSLSLGKQWIPGVHGPVSLAEVIHSVRASLSQKVRYKAWSKTSDTDLWPPHSCAPACIHTYTHSHTYIQHTHTYTRINNKQIEKKKRANLLHTGYGKKK